MWEEEIQRRLDALVRIADRYDDGGWAEFVDDLATRAAGTRRSGGGRVDNHGSHYAFAGGGGGEDRGAFGAVAEPKRGVLDVAAGVDFSRTGQNRRADGEFRIRRVGGARGCSRGFFEAAAKGGGEFLGHGFGGLKAEFLFGLGEGVDGKLEIGPAMGSAYLRADARGALRDHRIKEAHNVDAFFQHARSELLGERGVAQHHGHDGVSAGLDGKTGGGQAGAEEPGVLRQLVPEFGRTRKQVESGERGGDDHGCDRVGKQVGA